MLIAIQPIV